MSQEPRVIYTIPRNNGEEIHLSAKQYKDKHYFDLRLWYSTENDPTLKPTKKGITLGLDLLPELKKGFERLSKYAEKLRQMRPENVQE